MYASSIALFTRSSIRAPGLLGLQRQRPGARRRTQEEMGKQVTATESLKCFKYMCLGLLWDRRVCVFWGHYGFPGQKSRLFASAAPEAVKASCRHGSHAHISLSLNYKTIAVRIQIPKITTEHGSISKPPRPRAGAGLAQGLHNPL